MLAFWLTAFLFLVLAPLMFWEARSEIKTIATTAEAREQRVQAWLQSLRAQIGEGNGDIAYAWAMLAKGTNRSPHSRMEHIQLALRLKLHLIEQGVSLKALDDVLTSYEEVAR